MWMYGCAGKLSNVLVKENLLVVIMLASNLLFD